MIDWFQCHASYTRVLLLRDLYFWWPYFLRVATTSCLLYRCHTLLRFIVASYRRIYKPETEFAARKYFLAWERIHFHRFSVLGRNIHNLKIPFSLRPSENSQQMLCCWYASLQFLVTADYLTKPVSFPSRDRRHVHIVSGAHLDPDQRPFRDRIATGPGKWLLTSVHWTIIVIPMGGIIRSDVFMLVNWPWIWTTRC